MTAAAGNDTAIAGSPVETGLSDNLLGMMLSYALHSDSDLDAKKIYHTLSANLELEKNEQARMPISPLARSLNPIQGVVIPRPC